MHVFDPIIRRRAHSAFTRHIPSLEIGERQAVRLRSEEVVPESVDDEEHQAAYGEIGTPRR
jgi:hypothetical protein